jgi:hypothetical protein
MDSVDTPSSSVRYFEEQHFGQWWVLLIIGITTAIAWGFAVSEFVKLKITVDDTGVDARFWPNIGGRYFNAGDIANAEAVTYHPVKTFGGYGVRWGRGGRRAYNVSGDKAVELA